MLDLGLLKLFCFSLSQLSILISRLGFKPHRSLLIFNTCCCSIRWIRGIFWFKIGKTQLELTFDWVRFRYLTWSVDYTSPADIYRELVKRHRLEYWQINVFVRISKWSYVCHSTSVLVKTHRRTSRRHQFCDICKIKTETGFSQNFLEVCHYWIRFLIIPSVFLAW